MGLEIIVASTDTYLTTTQAVKAELGITTTSDDLRISNLIFRASAWAEEFVGYPLSAATYRETLAGYGTRNLMVTRTPIRSIFQLYYGTDTGGDAVELATTEYGVEHKPGFLTRNVGWEWSVTVQEGLELHPLPGQEYQPWMLDYVAGYVLGGMDTGSNNWSTARGTTSTGRTLPGDIEEAIIQRVVRTYEGRDDVVEKWVGDLRIRYDSYGGGDRIDVPRQRLMPYVRTF